MVPDKDPRENVTLDGEQQKQRYATLFAVVTGRVQGVGYRMFALNAARELGVRGYVRNQPDGSVLVYAVGGRPKLELLLSRMRQGPLAARVEEIKVEWSEIDEPRLPERFEVRG